MTETPTYNFVYQTICEKNGKSYVGVHKTTDINDGYIGCGIFKPSDAFRTKYLFHRAVKKHGYNSFRRYILSFYDTYGDALSEEKYIVNENWVRNSKNYNSAIGGRGNCMILMSKEQKDKLYSERSKKTIGRKRSKEFREHLSKIKTGVKLSDKHKEALKNNNARYWLGKQRPQETRDKIGRWHKGKTITTEAKRKMALAKYGKSPSNVVPVLQYRDDGSFVQEFKSVSEASKVTRIGRSNISNNLTEVSNSAGGYIFKYKNIIG